MTRQGQSPSTTTIGLKNTNIGFRHPGRSEGSQRYRPVFGHAAYLLRCFASLNMTSSFGVDVFEIGSSIRQLFTIRLFNRNIDPMAKGRRAALYIGAWPRVRGRKRTRSGLNGEFETGSICEAMKSRSCFDEKPFFGY